MATSDDRNGDTLLNLFVLAKRSIEGAPNIRKMTRLDMMIQQCVENATLARKSLEQRVDDLEAKEKEVLYPFHLYWYNVPLDHLTMRQYAQFAYLFINFFFNTETRIPVTVRHATAIEGDDRNAEINMEVTCTKNEASVIFAWLHLAHPKLAEFAHAVVPEWDPVANPADGISLYTTMMEHTAAAQARYSAYVKDDARKHGRDPMDASYFDAFLKGDDRTLNLLAKNIDCHRFYAYMLSALFDDLAAARMHARERAEADADFDYVRLRANGHYERGFVRGTELKERAEQLCAMVGGGEFTYLPLAEQEAAPGYRLVRATTPPPEAAAPNAWEPCLQYLGCSTADGEDVAPLGDIFIVPANEEKLARLPQGIIDIVAYVHSLDSAIAREGGETATATKLRLRKQITLTYFARHFSMPPK